VTVIHPRGVNADHLTPTYRPGTEMSQRYEIRVRGHLSPTFAAALGDPEATAAPAQTIVRRSVESPADLHEILRRCQSLGLELVEVRRLPASDRATPAGHRRADA
jgi:hypothetical protein